jgi:CHAT domain
VNDFDEHAYLRRLDKAGVDAFAEMLLRPTADERSALIARYGDERYDRLHQMALRRSSAGATSLAQPGSGNVVVIHGFMGSSLTSYDRCGEATPIWLDTLALAQGMGRRLLLSHDGRTEHDPGYEVRPISVLTQFYGELVLNLACSWRVRAFYYDWRKDVREAAAALNAKTTEWFGEGANFHIVAHGLGGLVARMFIDANQARWDAMPNDPAHAGGRLVMLGTPGHGSFAALRAMTGLSPSVKRLERVDLVHSGAQIVEVLDSFPAMYQLLPSPFSVPQAEPLYDASSWGDSPIVKEHLAAARKVHEVLRDQQLVPATTYDIVGCGERTPAGLTSWKVLPPPRMETYVMGSGDGFVAHELGAPGAQTFHVRATHGGLSTHPLVHAAIDEILRAGTASGLSTQCPPSSGGVVRPRLDEPLRSPSADRSGSRPRSVSEDEREVEDLVIDRLQEIVDRMVVEARGENSRAILPSRLRDAEHLVVYGFLGEDDPASVSEPSTRFPTPKVTIRLVLGEIGTFAPVDPIHPVDTIAVGHYSNVIPQDAERALEVGIFEDEDARRAELKADQDPWRRSGLFTQFGLRGILRGRLGEPFFLPDPRTPTRLLAVAGMGEPGRFGIPELTVLARELVWSLGRMDRKHLAAVLIGSGVGNIEARDAIDAWIRGIKHALSGDPREEPHQLETVTFVEADGSRLQEVHQAMDAIIASLQGRLTITYDQTGDDERTRTAKQDGEGHAEAFSPKKATKHKRDDAEQLPTRITLALEANKYTFGAITADASVPEREVAIDPKLVWQANDELAAERDPKLQLERGVFLSQLLLPKDLKSQLSTNAPLVMLMDASAARVHWEMVAQPDAAYRSGADSDGAGTGQGPADLQERFLGTGRGFTRQLRTPFAPPPEPPPPPQRVLRVLVVADPGDGRWHLPGAELEGVEVADLLERFNVSAQEHPNRIDVIRMIGPHRATRTNVLRALTVQTVDVLHFAGHCTYDAVDRARSGWIFGDEERLTASELQRVDRIPKFVFSNACESGVTPDRSENRSVDLAPTFAEAFFSRGVSNFVCTAWPVSDIAARKFAKTLYGSLLGMPEGDLTDSQPGADPDATVAGGLPMYAAMRRARIGIMGTQDGARTWGAYQHYGNPHFRLFAPTDAAARPGG